MKVMVLSNGKWIRATGTIIDGGKLQTVDGAIYSPSNWFYRRR